MTPDDPTEITEHDPSLAEVVSMGCDESTGEVFLINELNGQSLQELIPKLGYLAERLDRITLVVYSPGGSDTAMMALADFISSLSTPVDLRAWGQCSSAAAVLFAVCAHRVVGPHTEAVFHAFSCSMDGEPLTGAFHRESLTRTQRYATDLATLFAERCPQLSFPTLVSIFMGDHREMRLYGAELVQMGLADHVIGSAGPLSPAQLELFEG